MTKTNFTLSFLKLTAITLAFSANYFVLKYSPVTADAATLPGVYWGALIRGHAGNPTYPTDYGDVPYDLRTLSLFESNTGKGASIIHFAQPWKNSSGAYMNFPASLLTDIRNHGSIPMFNWGSWQLGKGVNQPAFKLSKIANGDYDTYVTQFAKDAAAWGQPMFIRFDHEMNIGGQFSWNFSDTWTDPATGTTYKNSPDDFIRMWRHVVTIFRNQGANNVTWVWCPNIYFRSGSKALPFMQAYPGDTYVDWTCVDGYNKSTSMSSFSSIFSDSYKVLQQQVTGSDTACSSLVGGCNPGTKPMMIGEWASVEAGDDGTKKANWVTDSLSTQLPLNFPKIKAVVWFNSNTANGLIVESTAKAKAAFKTAIASPYYAGNVYSAIANSPIPALIGSVQATPTPTVTAATPTPVSSGTAGSSSIVWDTFSRTLSSGWGSADNGGSYAYSPTSTVFSDNGSSGTMKVASANSQLKAGLPSTSAKDIEFTVRVKPDKLTSGGIYLAGVTLRETSSGSYRALLKFDSGNIYLLAQKYLSSTGGTYDLSSAVQLGITQVADNYYWIKGQISGSSPTVIKLKAWHINDTEPSSWQYTASDFSTTQLTTNGDLGLFSRVGSGNTNLPVNFSYDEFKATDLSSSTNTPIPVKTGDANADGVVDLNDMYIIIANYGKSTPNGASDGDFNKDSKVNGVDYSIWQKNYQP